MACRLTCLALDSRDPEKLAEFWCAVLDCQVVEREGMDLSIGPLPGTTDMTIDLLHSTNPKVGKIPLHLDLNATDRRQDEELQRLLDLRAQPVDIGQGEVSWYVLADPEGNEFCLLRRTVPA